MTAWTGLSTWAAATKNEPLQAEATWMLAGEQSTALLYGLQLDKGEKVYQGFGTRWCRSAGVASGTTPRGSRRPLQRCSPSCCSPRARAPPYLAGDPDRIRAQVEEATAGTGYAQQFGDYLLMYAGLAGEEDRETALTEASSLDANGWTTATAVVRARVAHGPSVSVGA